jgi:hypothetical protein
MIAGTHGKFSHPGMRLIDNISDYKSMKVKLAIVSVTLKIGVYEKCIILSKTTSEVVIVLSFDGLQNYLIIIWLLLWKFTNAFDRCGELFSSRLLRDLGKAQ